MSFNYYIFIVAYCKIEEIIYMKKLKHYLPAAFVVLVPLFLFSAPAFSQDIKADDNSSRQKETVAAPVSEPAPVKETTQFIKDKTEVKAETIEKTIPSYRMRLKDILKEAEENIKKVDQEIEQQKVGERNKEREARVKEAFERGNALYKEGKSKEARAEWKKALDISKDPEMRGYLEAADKKSREEDRRLEEGKALAEKKMREEAKAREAEQREKERIEREAQRKQEAEAGEKARQEELEKKQEGKKARLEREASEKAAELKQDHYSEAENNMAAMLEKLDQAEAKEKARQEKLANREQEQESAPAQEEAQNKNKEEAKAE